MSLTDYLNQNSTPLSMDICGFILGGIIVLVFLIAYVLQEQEIKESYKKEESERINKSLEHLAARRV